MEWGNYRVSHIETEGVDMSMNICASPSLEMYCSLPNGTEMFCIEIAPFGIAARAMGVTMTDENREKARKWAADEGRDTMPFSIMVYTLPEGLEIPSDLGEVLNEGYVRLGLRHGSEGTAMFSESLLRERYSEMWNEEAYEAYVKAYKLGAQRRKGN